MTKGLPYRGWYDGNVELQFANGTYADFREMFVEKVKLNKMKQAELDELDRRWEEIPLEERMRRRSVVVENGTPREVTVLTHDGPLVMMKCVPDEGDNVKIMREKAKKKKDRRLPSGALTEENSPFRAALVPSPA